MGGAGPGGRAGTGTGRRPGRRRGGSGRRRFPADRGSATVWSVGAIAVLCVVFGAVLALGHAVVVRHRAAGGADLAALAAADHWAEGGAAACARADQVAGAQGTRLVRCTVEGEISDVSVAAGRTPFAAEVRARAGPATTPAHPGGPAGPGTPPPPAPPLLPEPAAHPPPGPAPRASPPVPPPVAP
ncbi:flp pilus-assembly TadE/G-like family protein [Streptomyces sp. SBST2-5]|uniref:Flp pilus-assembly TadE/G-like family protein n=1 Tax=Streptomyces composti TaxID=2720025 RepID=A0ABX1A651_9ACTN|nr:flp pilus-assembly TadE/G-like family protein [Streptomyces composti]